MVVVREDMIYKHSGHYLVILLAQSVWSKGAHVDFMAGSFLCTMCVCVCVCVCVCCGVCCGVCKCVMGMKPFVAIFCGLHL